MAGRPRNLIDMQSPWLSVVMPVHDGARDLPHTLASAAAAGPDGVEFIIYDSSTNTACRDIAAAYASQLAIHYAAMPDMRAWPDKTNLAVTRASAPWVAMLHQDDIWLPGHLEAARASIAAHPDAVMSVAASSLIDMNGRPVGQWSLPLGAGAWTGANFGRRLIVQNFVAIPSPLIRRDAWLAAGGMDGTLWYTADWDLYLKLAGLGSIAVRPLATTAFRIHGNSLTMTGSRNAASLREQLDIVLERHGDAFGLANDSRLRARASVSAEINCSLAQVAAGRAGSIGPALLRLLALGPLDALRYLHESRLADRALPRLRARLAGNL